MLVFPVITFNTIFLSLIGAFVGVLLGIKINAKLNLLFYVVVGVGVAYLLGAFPYYELPMSFSFLLSLGGLLIGALINRIFKK